MLKLNKEILETFYFRELRKQYPTFPEFALPPPKYTDTTANTLTKCIKDFLNYTGHQAERISSGGRTIDNRKMTTDGIGRNVQVGSTKYIPGTSTNGTADVSAVIFRLPVKIEVKIGKDKQSKDQIKYQENVERAGGIYWIAKDFDGFIEDYRKLMIANRKIHVSAKGVEFVVVNKSLCIIQFIENLDTMILTNKQILPYEE